MGGGPPLALRSSPYDVAPRRHCYSLAWVCLCLNRGVCLTCQLGFSKAEVRITDLHSNQHSRYSHESPASLHDHASRNQQMQTQPCKRLADHGRDGETAESISE